MEAEGLHTPVNLGNPHEISVRELAEHIVNLTGSRSQITYLPLPQDDPTQRCPDISRARESLDWYPVTPLETGLEKTIAYFDTLLQSKDA